MLISSKSAEVLLHAVFISDGEFAGHETSEARDALLTVQNLEVILGDLVEIDQTKRIALQQRGNNCHVALAVCIDVVSLILRLDSEPSRETI